jgi:hypothetical protein
MPRLLSVEAQQRMIRMSVGRRGGTSIRSLIEWVFGRRRTAHALAVPGDDPELIDFALALERRVSAEWTRRGIPRHVGPYVADDNDDHSTTIVE